VPVVGLLFVAGAFLVVVASLIENEASVSVSWYRLQIGLVLTLGFDDLG